jgi:hypothetical protein
LESAIPQTRRGIHGNDVERLKLLLANNRRCCRGTATIAIDNLKVSVPQVKIGDSLTITADVANTSVSRRR